MAHASRPAGARVRRPLVTALALGAVATLALAGPVGAFTWTQTTLRTASGVDLRDLDIGGHDVAVVWQEPGPVTKLRLSQTDGSTFGSTIVVASNVRQATVDICDHHAFVAYARDDRDVDNPDLWDISVRSWTMSGTFFGESGITFGPDPSRWPDVACAGGQLFVTWEQRVGGQWHVLVDHGPLPSPMFTWSPVDLGPIGANAGHPVVGGSADRAYVVWPTPAGHLRIHTWSTGSVFADLGEQQLAASGAIPRIAAAGNKVSVAWFDCGDIRVRTSANRASSWGTTRTVFTGACGSEFGGVPASIALKGSRSVIAYQWFSGFSNQKERMITSTNDFATRSDRLGYAGSDGFALSWVAPSGTPKLAGAVDTGSAVRFLRQP